MGINKVILVGNLGRDPEIRHTQSGQAVATFSVATNRRWRDKEGQQQEKTEWHRVVAWARLAEICAEYLSQGSLVYLEGRLQTRDGEDPDANKGYRTEVVVLEMEMLGRRGDAARGAPQDAPSVPPGPGDTPGATPPPGGDDIPF